EWRLRGSHRIQLEVGADRTAARALYAGLGFVEQGKYFEIGPISTRGIEPSAGVVVRPIEDSDGDFPAVNRLLAEPRRAAPAGGRCGTAAAPPALGGSRLRVAGQILPDRTDIDAANRAVRGCRRTDDRA